jgi:hypothetical protein
MPRSPKRRADPEKDSNGARSRAPELPSKLRRSKRDSDKNHTTKETLLFTPFPAKDNLPFNSPSTSVIQAYGGAFRENSTAFPNVEGQTWVFSALVADQPPSQTPVKVVHAPV